MKNRPLYQKVLIALAAFLVLSSWWSRHSEAQKRKQGVLAIVHVYGTIHTSLTASAWGNSDADDIAHRLHSLSEDDDVKAILLRINSPGGTVGGVQEIHSEILRCKAKGKKVIASLGDVAASGGYYLASAADKVVAEPGTITGSIGVILEFGNLEGLFQKLGVRLEVIKSGAHKDIGSPARSLTAEEKQMLQASINDAYDQFVDAVKAGRHLPDEKVRALADGRIFTGRQALQVGLVDALGNKEEAVQVAIQLAHLPAHPATDSDTSKSFGSLMQHISSEEFQSSLFGLDSRWPGPQLEYRWQ